MSFFFLFLFLFGEKRSRKIGKRLNYKRLNKKRNGGTKNVFDTVRRVGLVIARIARIFFFLLQIQLKNLYCSDRDNFGRARSLWFEIRHSVSSVFIEIQNLFSKFLNCEIAEESVTKTNCCVGGTHETMVDTCHARRSRSIYFHRALSLPRPFPLSIFFFQISSARVTQPQFSALFNTEQSSCHGNTAAAELIEIEKVWSRFDV